MRVAINAFFWPRTDTGSGQYVRRLVEHLSALESPPQLLLLTPPAGRSSRAENLRKVWFEQIAYPRGCRRERVDVAHVPYWAPPVAPTVPTVVTIHDVIPLMLREYRGRPAARAYTALVSAAVERAALVITDSEASRRDILARLPVAEERVRVIPLAPDPRYGPLPAADDAAVRAHYGLPERYLLYLGGFDCRKNVAAALAAETWIGPVLGAACPLVVAGRLPERDTPFAPDPRRQAGEMGLSPEWVRFIGGVPDEDKPALYRGAVAFIFPSRYEGFGLPPLEALACGIPVVGSDAASLPEVVGDAGVLLEPNDTPGMAGALLQLAEDADFRAELSRRALAQAARFSWERTARETLEVYEEVR